MHCIALHHIYASFTQNQIVQLEPTLADQTPSWDTFGHKMSMLQGYRSLNPGISLFVTYNILYILSRYSPDIFIQIYLHLLQDICCLIQKSCRDSPGTGPRPSANFDVSKLRPAPEQFAVLDVYAVFFHGKIVSKRWKAAWCNCNSYVRI